MRKPTNRDKLLAQGLRVVHQQGLAGASVRDIVQAAGVPQGSFSNHFASKEAFGVEILARIMHDARRFCTSGEQARDGIRLSKSL